MELDIETEMALLRQTLERARNAGHDFAPMAVAITNTGEHIPIVSMSKEIPVIAQALRSFQATQVLLARDAWFNQQPTDQEHYVPPSEDPFAREVLVVIYATRNDAATYNYPYHMEGGKVVWDSDIPHMWGKGEMSYVRDLFVLQEALL